MKSAYLLTALLLTTSFSAHAEFVESTAHEQTEIQTVSLAKKASDGQIVTLEGYITGRAGTLNPEQYLFKDDTDVIKVEIDDDIWQGKKITPQTHVRITGEIDRNPINKSVEIEVEHLEIIQSEQ